MVSYLTIFSPLRVKFYSTLHHPIPYDPTPPISSHPQVLFGIATSMPVALTFRFIMGLFNGLIGAAKAMAPELVPPGEQASAMSMIAATWGLGNLLGPAIGGDFLDTSWTLLGRFLDIYWTH